MKIQITTLSENTANLPAAGTILIGCIIHT